MYSKLTNTQDRLWRKNREPNENSACIGTDLNRNYDVVFNASENNNVNSQGLNMLSNNIG